MKQISTLPSSSIALSLGGAEPTVVAIRGVVSRYPVAPLALEQMLGGRVNIYDFAWHIHITYNI